MSEGRKSYRLPIMPQVAREKETPGVPAEARSIVPVVLEGLLKTALDCAAIAQAASEVTETESDAAFIASTSYHLGRARAFKDQAEALQAIIGLYIKR